MSETVRAALVGAERADRDLDETEAGLNALIERRARASEDAGCEEESFKETTGIYNAERREANRHAWRAYFKRAAANHRGLAERMEARAEEVARYAL